MKEPPAKRPESEAKAAERPAPRHGPRRTRRRRPKPAPRRIAAQPAPAPPRMAERDQPGYREAVEAGVARMRAAFALRTDGGYRAGAKVLESISDERIADLQTEWRRQTGGDLFPYLLAHTSQGLTPGLSHAVDLLRKAFARNPPLQRAFMTVYAAPDIIGSYAAMVRDAFLLGRPEDALVVLQEQPPAVRALIDAQFGKGGLAAFIIRTIDRDEASVRAIALLRTGIGRSATVYPFIELGVVLIPASNRNQKQPVEILRALPFSKRRPNEDAFNKTFDGVGPEPGLATPARLREYLRDKFTDIFDQAERQEAFALLHHELTDAEKLFLYLPAWTATKNDSAVGLMERIAEKGTTRQALDADWKAFVNTGMEGEKAFTGKSLPDYIDHVFFLTRSTPRVRLLALYYALPQAGAPAEPAAAAPPPSWQARTEEDAARTSEEAATIRAALATVHALKGRFMGDDDAIVGALRKVSATYAARIDRLEKRIAEAGADETLTPAERDRLIAGYTSAAETTRAAAGRKRRELTALVTGGALHLWQSDRDAARVALTGHMTAADEYYDASLHHDHAKMVEVVTKAWAAHGIDRMHADAAAPGTDALGLPLRPAYSLSLTVMNDARELYARRIMTLAAGNCSDVLRGVSRLRLELAQGKSNSDLAGVVSLLSMPELDPKLRDAVIAAYAGLLRDEGNPAARDAEPGASPARIFLDHILTGRYGADTAEAGEGAASNYLALSKLLLPPRTAAERADHARALRASARRGVAGGVKAWLADRWDDLSMQNLGAAVDRSQDALDFVRGASDEELAPVLKYTGKKDRDDLSAAILETFESRHKQRQAVETACAQLVSGVVEVVVESLLALGTGGVGMAAVFDSVAASIASMMASEALLGPDYDLVTTDNLNMLLQSTLGTMMVELDLRDVIVKAMPLTSIEPRWGGKGILLQQGTHNVVTGVLEQGALSSAEMLVGILAADKWPSSEDLAKHADMMFGRLIAKVHSTPFTVRYNPGKYYAYMDMAERLKTNAIFKLALKITEGGAKELVSQAFSSAHDQTFADRFVQFLWKEARGTVSATTKAAASAVGQEANIAGERGLIDRVRQAHPAEFSVILHAAVMERYSDPEKGAQLRAEHKRHTAGGRRLSELDFMLWKVAQPDAAGLRENAELRGKIHKAVVANASLLAGRPATKGLAALRQPGTKLDVIAAGEAESLGWSKARARATQTEQATAAIDRYITRIHDPHSPLSGRVRAMMLGRLQDHAAEAPDEFAHRALLVAEILEGVTPLARGVLRGDPAAMETFIDRHGDWRQAVEMLEAAGPHRAYVASLMRDHRDRLAARLKHDFGAELAGNASQEPISDHDYATASDDAGAKMLAAEQHMLETKGKNWQQKWNINFFVDAQRATQYMDVFRALSPARRVDVQLKLTNAAEVYTFAKMLRVTEFHPDLRRRVLQTAEGVGFPISLAQDFLDSTRKVLPDARRAELALEIDRKVAEYRRATLDGKLAIRGTARHDLAIEISTLQMEQNYYTTDANIGGGTDRSVLHQVNVTGLEAYQAALYNHAAYIEHRVQPNSAVQYPLGKYVSRTVHDLRVPGVDHAALHKYQDMGRAVYKGDRYAYRTGGSFAARQSPPPPATEVLEARYSAYEQDMIPVLGQLRALARANPDLHQPLPRPPDSQRAATPNHGPVPQRAAASGTINAVSPARVEAMAAEAKVVVAPMTREAAPATGTVPPAPVLPPRFASEAAFDKAMGWDAPARRFTSDHARTVMGLKTLDMAVSRRDYYQALAEQNPHDTEAQRRAAVMALLVDRMRDDAEAVR